MPGFNITGQEITLGPNPQIETARSYRWRVRLPGVVSPGGDGPITFYAHSMSRPSPEFDSITIYNGATEIKLPGKYRWSTINLKFYEKLDLDNPENSTAGVLRRWWASNIYDIKTHRLQAPDRVYNFMKQTCIISLLSGRDEITYEYRLTMAFPVKIEGSDMDYTATDISTTSVTLAFSGVAEGKPQ